MSERDIFTAAREMTDPTARTAYVDGACGGDAGLRARVEALLRAHDQPDSLLDHPAVAPQGPAVGDSRTLDYRGRAPADDEVPLGFLEPATRPDSLGRLGHYEVLQVLGKGGFGIVFRAFDDILQRVVALKVMAPQLATTSPARKRFLREARSSAQVRHENVVQVYEVAEQPLPYLAMEFIPGETLQQKLDRTGPLDVPEILRIGRQIAEGLAAAHATELIHRDIKPGNVLLESGQHKVKITDFGLARTADDASISQSGVIAGTPMYMAPEQAQGQTLDQRADLFSLGSVLYQMVAGRPPFRASTAVAVLKRVAEDTPRAIREIIPEAPQWLCDIIAKLHAKNPDERYQSAREVADVLADCENQLKAHARLRDYSRIPRGKPQRSARRTWVAAALIAMVFLCIGIYAVTRQWQNSGVGPARSTTVTWGEVVDPLGDCRFTEENGRLAITVPGDQLHDLNPLPGCNLNAPCVLRKVQGDFEARVTVNPYPRPTSADSTGPFGSFVAAGLVVWSGEANFLRLFRGASPLVRAKDGARFIAAEWYTGLTLGGEKSIAIPDGPLRLRIRRTGDTLHLASSTDGQTWTQVTTVTNFRPAAELRVGVAVVNSVKHDLTVQFEGFEIKELPSGSPEVPRTAADVLQFLAGDWKVAPPPADVKLPPDAGRDALCTTFDFVAGGKFLRQRGMRHAIFAYDTDKGILRQWAAASTAPSGLTWGPATGIFNSTNRTVTWTVRRGEGIEDDHQEDHVDANTINLRVFQRDAKDNIVQSSPVRLTRVNGPVRLPDWPMDPNRPPEMKVLDRLVGEWRNEMTVSVAGPETKVERVCVKAEPILGGRFIEKFETNEATGASDYMLGWFDTDAKKYRTWFFNHSGSVIELTGTWDEATKTLTWNSADGRLEGRWTFKSDDLREYRHLVKDKDGKVLSEATGTSRRITSPAVAPFTDANVQRIAALPAYLQVEEVRKELKRRNPRFDGKIDTKIEGGVVTEFRIVTDMVTDIAPIRAFDALRVLECVGTWTHSSPGRRPVPNGLLTDLTPLTEMNLASLTHLSLSATNVGDAGMVYFKDCKNLTYLDLFLTQVGDAGLVHFKDCKALTALNLEGTKVGDAGLVHFKDCKALTGLTLAGTKVSDAGLANFKDCKNLINLWLHGTQVDDAGLVHFQDCKALKTLNLARTKVTGGSLARFQDCKNLKYVWLDYTPVNDAGVAQLKGFRLRKLSVDNTAVTDLTPLREMPLEEIRLTPKNIRRGLDILRDMRSLETIGIAWLQTWPAAEFWERYDRGEFKD